MCLFKLSAHKEFLYSFKILLASILIGGMKKTLKTNNQTDRQTKPACEQELANHSQDPRTCRVRCHRSCFLVEAGNMLKGEDDENDDDDDDIHIMTKCHEK